MKKINLRSNKKLLLLSILILFILTFSIHVIYVNARGDIFRGIEFSKAYSDRNGELLQVFLTEDEQYRIYKSIKEYPPEFIEALLLQEDRYFYKHIGINPVAIIKAGWETYIKRSRRMGASTITMQVAKLKYNLYTKSIWGKIRQINRALYLELCFSKEEILDAYVNLVPVGGNVIGFEAGSWYYFNKPITKLNLSENIMLCVLPQNPTKRAPTPQRTPSELIEARKVLFKAWLEKHPEDAEYQLFMDMQMSTECCFPNKARHFTEMLAMDPSLIPENNRGVIRTSLNASIQEQIEELYDVYLKQNEHFGVNNGAVLLVDWQKMEVIANIGSADYYNNDIQGQVNATTSKRSPGSTLKPFIYAMAIDQGIIHYRTMLKDTPVTFNEYSPDNYGSIFKGPVQAWFALSDSRNIPAITLEQKIHDPDLYDFMQMSNVSEMKDREHYGLSIVLGTCEVTMLELAKMYGTLANNGFQKELHFTPQYKTEPGTQMFSPESAFIVRKMLENNVPPYQSKPEAIKDIPVAYKTGTSIGFKDSWSVGIFDRYIIIVWIGNFDGHGNNAFLGRRMSAPLLFNIAYKMLSETPKDRLLPREIPPENAIQVKVCSVSGGIPNDSCPQTEWSWFVPGVSPIDKCKIHRKINIDKRTGYRTDETNKPYIQTVVREFWPSDLQSLFEQAGLPRLVPPEYPPDEIKYDYTKQGYPPEIISPMANTEYIYRISDTSRNKIMLCAVADADVSELIWFEGPNFITRTKPDQSVEWSPLPGNYFITVTDQKGRADYVNIAITQTE